MYAYDRFERNEMYAAERDESRCARQSMTEMERAQSCRHTRRRGHACPDCGDDLRGEM